MLTLGIVEDAVAIREELSIFLRNNGFEVKCVEVFDDVVTQVLEMNLDCLLLDLNLPEVDGHYICRKIREVSQLPIIVVTSRNNDIDELMSLNLGADDFITKPYNLQVLIAHINRLLERTHTQAISHIIEFKGIVVDASKGVLQLNGKSLDLTKNEIKIITHLLKNVGQIISRDELAEYMWNDAVYIDENTLTVNVNRLRKKLDELGAKNLIETKWGMGYVIYEDYSLPQG